MTVILRISITSMVFSKSGFYINPNVISMDIETISRGAHAWLYLRAEVLYPLLLLIFIVKYSLAVNFVLSHMYFS